MAFLVAIVGRPNVGKSTLFNRLTGQRKAIVDDLSGVTRDRHYGESDWGGKEFAVVDTGGFVPNSDDLFEKAIREQVEIAIEESALLILMVDVTTGITDLDQQMARMLIKQEKPVLLAVNKVDNSKRQLEVGEFYGLGFEDVFALSSINGGGTGEILDRLIEFIPEETPSIVEEDIPKIAILGQPNVGKSSLLNALIGEERNIVTKIAGTTRDAIHTRYNLFQKDVLLIDTAGLRKRAKVHENLEFYSVMRTVKALDIADVCLIMIDAQNGLEAQDLNIFSLAARKKKGVVILVNKWDLVNKERNLDVEITEKIAQKLAPFKDVPILFISALNKQRINKALDLALGVYRKRSQKIPTSKLNEFLQEALEHYPPPSVKGKFVKIKYCTQLPTKNPSFAFFCNLPQYIKEPYRNYLENRFRENFDFTGVPISIYFRKK